MKHKVVVLSLLLLPLFAGCCENGDDEAWKSLSEKDRTTYFVNLFAHNMMSTYYLWNKEIKKDLDQWPALADPVKTVRNIRYKDAQGNDIDKWTQVTDNYAAFQGQVSGNTKSCGLDFMLFYANEKKENVIAVVTYTYASSPAANAGLKRGDKIVALNGQLITPSNYQSLITSTLRGSNPTVITLDDGSEQTLTPVDMYLNPVNVHKVIDYKGKKIGYLHFTSFTLKACQDLIEVFKEFKSSGITELVMDLRYNGGGYSQTSEVLASMIVPEVEINKESIFQRDIYNSILTEAWGEETSVFKTDFTIEEGQDKYVISTADANPGVQKVYALITSSSASASEALICGLLPYMDIELVGQNSHGKYCGGFIVDGPSWCDWVQDSMSASEYEAAMESTDNWGIYVMVSRYADKNGETPCMPNGFTPDILVEDNPLDGHMLGDVEETMLAAALSGNVSQSRKAVSRSPLVRMEDQMPRLNIRINNFNK